MGHAIAPAPEPVPPKRAAHYLWAVLIARIYEVFPLLCPLCGGQMRIIAFITHSADIRHILEHIGVASEPPQISPARGPPLQNGTSHGPLWGAARAATVQPTRLGHPRFLDAVGAQTADFNEVRSPKNPCHT